MSRRRPVVKKKVVEEKPQPTEEAIDHSNKKNKNKDKNRHRGN